MKNWVSELISFALTIFHNFNLIILAKICGILLAGLSSFLDISV